MRMSAGRFTRAGAWAIAAYAGAYGLATLGDPDRANPYRIVAALLGVWFALVGTAALVLLLDQRRPAVVGMLAAVGGAVAQLSMAVPAGTPMGELTAGRLVVIGLLVHGAGWYLLGRAVVRDGVFNQVDGVLLMLAAPLVGPVGALVGPLRTVGAMLLAAGGLGIALTASQRAPTAGSPAPTASRRARPPAGSGRMPAWPPSSSPTRTTSGSPTTGR
jgi:hypothetical protein